MERQEWRGGWEEGGRCGGGEGEERASVERDPKPHRRHAPIWGFPHRVGGHSYQGGGESAPHPPFIHTLHSSLQLMLRSDDDGAEELGGIDSRGGGRRRERKDGGDLLDSSLRGLAPEGEY